MRSVCARIAQLSGIKTGRMPAQSSKLQILMPTPLLLNPGSDPVPRTKQTPKSVPRKESTSPTPRTTQSFKAPPSPKQKLRAFGISRRGKRCHLHALKPAPSILVGKADSRSAAWQNTDRSPWSPLVLETPIATIAGLMTLLSWLWWLSSSSSSSARFSKL